MLGIGTNIAVFTWNCAHFLWECQAKPNAKPPVQETLYYSNINDELD